MNPKNQALMNVQRIQRLERDLAREAAKVAELRLQLFAIEKLATDTAGDPADLLRQIAQMFEVKQ